MAHAHHSKNPPLSEESMKRWICLYPSYIDKKKTRAEGRRIPIEKAVEAPTAQEIRDVISAAGLPVGLEAKAYCRERSNEPHLVGRVRVKLKNENGSPVNPKYTSRDALMLYAAEFIPKLKVRVEKNQKSHHEGQSGGSKKKKKR